MPQFAGAKSGGVVAARRAMFTLYVWGVDVIEGTRGVIAAVCVSGTQSVCRGIGGGFGSGVTRLLVTKDTSRVVAVSGIKCAELLRRGCGWRSHRVSGSCGIG